MLLKSSFMRACPRRRLAGTLSVTKCDGFIVRSPECSARPCASAERPSPIIAMQKGRAEGSNSNSPSMVAGANPASGATHLSSVLVLQGRSSFLSLLPIGKSSEEVAWSFGQPGGNTEDWNRGALSQKVKKVSFSRWFQFFLKTLDTLWDWS